VLDKITLGGNNMKNKKFLSIILIAVMSVVMIALFAACGGSNNNSTGENGGDNVGDTPNSNSALVGRWRNNDATATVLEFFADGTGFAEHAGGENRHSFTWSEDRGDLTFVVDGNRHIRENRPGGMGGNPWEQSFTTQYSVSDNQLTIFDYLVIRDGDDNAGTVGFGGTPYQNWIFTRLGN